MTPSVAAPGVAHPSDATVCLCMLQDATSGLATFSPNEKHRNCVVDYLRFARTQRSQHLKSIDACLEELKYSRSDPYTNVGSAVANLRWGGKRLSHPNIMGTPSIITQVLT